MEDPPATNSVLAEVGPRLNRVRTHRKMTLAQLAAATGISKSTLSRLETGQRKPSLELLLPIAQAFQVPLEELVGAPEVGDPRIRLKPRRRRGRIVVPLTGQVNGRHAWKVLIPPEPGEPEMRVHEGNEWLYVLSGKLRLILGDREITLNAGEVAEFDTSIPHWFGPADHQPAEILSLLSGHGKHMHIRAIATAKTKRTEISRTGSHRQP